MMTVMMIRQMPMFDWESGDTNKACYWASSVLNRAWILLVIHISMGRARGILYTWLVHKQGRDSDTSVIVFILKLAN